MIPLISSKTELVNYLKQNNEDEAINLKKKISFFLHSNHSNTLLI